MKDQSNSIKLLLVSIFLVLGLSLSSCSWKPSEEEIQTLEETRSATLDAEKAQQDKKAQADDLQSQVDAKKKELENVKAEKEKVTAGAEARKAETTEAAE